MTKSINVPANCGTVVDRLLSRHPSLISAEPYPEPHRMVLDFNPTKVMDEAVGRLVKNARPAVASAYARCSLRQVGRACKSRAFKLERIAEKIGGVSTLDDASILKFSSPSSPLSCPPPPLLAIQRNARSVASSS